jgi:gamma-glutamyltranspeptidase
MLYPERTPTRAAAMATKGMVSSPHYLATLAGLRVLQNGGSAVDAAIAVNATLGVVYPHMTGMGGDAFWLIHDAATSKVHALNGSGRAIAAADTAYFAKTGHGAIPMRGCHAALTVPGAVDSWCLAHERFGRLSLADTLAAAIDYARDGFPVSPGQARFTQATMDVLAAHPDTARIFLPDGQVPKAGQIMRLERLADTMEAVARHGRAGFYDGAVRDEIVRALNAAGASWQVEDISGHSGDWGLPISTTYRGHTLYQHPPNSQGFVHLMVMNMLENFDLAALGPESADYVHLVVEATKLAFIDRDRYLSDPSHGDIPLGDLLSKDYARDLASRISMDRAASRPLTPMGQDTTCAVVVDGEGNAASVIQSLYHEFGSGLVAGDTGVLIQNRGAAFSLDPGHINVLKPGKRTFHTLMPGMAFKDGKPSIVYGTMGGEGQPQTSTAVATRIIDFGLGPQHAVDAPRWLYGRTWGADTTSLRIEERLSAEIGPDLLARGHDVEVLPDWSDTAGHAAAITVEPRTGLLTGAADPRGEGIAAGW